MFNKKKKINEMNSEHIAEETNEQNEQPVEQDQPNSAETETISAEEQLKNDNAALNDKYLRLFAEFDNYKRRTQKERVELLQTAGKDVIVSLLPVLDDFDRALKATDSATEVSAIRDGILLVQSKLNSILSQKGLKEIVSTDAAFDTDVHEAITNIPAPAPELKGKVIDTLEKGYTLNDKVIRFSKVVVGS